MSNISFMQLLYLVLSDEELELAMRSGKVRRLHPIALHPDGEWDTVDQPHAPIENGWEISCMCEIEVKNLFPEAVNW